MFLVLIEYFLAVSKNHSKFYSENVAFFLTYFAVILVLPQKSMRNILVLKMTAQVQECSDVNVLTFVCNDMYIKEKASQQCLKHF